MKRATKQGSPNFDRKGLPGSRYAARQHRLQRLRPAGPRLLTAQSIPLFHADATPPQGNQMNQTNVTAITAPRNHEVGVEQMSDLRERVRAIAEDTAGYSQARISKEVGISSATLSQFLGGTYQGNMQKVAGQVNSWLETYDARQAQGGLPQPPEWVDTPTSQRITAGLRYAQLAGGVVVIYGGAGLGKTKSIQRYRQQAPNVWHVELSPATGSVLSCLEEIAIAVGCADYVRTAGHLQRAILKRIRGTNGLLVIDEAQHLNVQALDQVRSLNDQSGVGLVLTGNDRVYTQMTGGNRAAYLDRLYSRIDQKIHLRRSTQGDADAIIKAWGIDDSPCRDRIREIAAKPGALRVLSKVLRMAAAYAMAQNHRIGCEDIKQAARELGVFE